ncbi:MAG: hypothetical protein R3B13_09035 [Polyangiaceae bacterium]
MYRRWAHRVVFATAISAVSSFSNDACAEPSAGEKETARKLVKAGRQKLADGDVEAALKDLKAAHSIMGVPTTGLALGKAQLEGKHLVEARDTFLSVTRLPVLGREPWQFTKARKECLRLAAEIEPQIPLLRLRFRGLSSDAAVSVLVDGEPLKRAAFDVPLAVNPGPHEVVVRVGEREKKSEVSVSLGEKTDHVVDVRELLVEETPLPAKQTPSEAAPHRTMMYVGFGVAGAGVLVGGVTGLMAFSKSSSVEGDCVDNRCPPSTHDDIDAGRTLGTVSTVSFALAGAGAALGVWALLASPDAAADERKSAGATPFLGPKGVGVRGRF